MCVRYVLSYWPGASVRAAERVHSDFLPMNERLNMLEGAFGRGVVQLHIGALSYHSDLFRHEPETFEANATLCAALCPGLRRSNLNSEGTPDSDSCSASCVHLQSQTLTATGFVSAKRWLKSVAHLFH